MSLIQDQIEAISFLNDVIERMRNRIAKQKADGDAEEPDRSRRTRRGGNLGTIQLGALATNDQNRLVSVTPGEALFSRSRQALMRRADRNLAALNEKLAKALAKCAQQRNAMAGPGGTQQLADGTHVPLQRKGVSLACPQAIAIQKQISEYVARTFGDVGPSAGGR